MQSRIFYVRICAGNKTFFLAHCTFFRSHPRIITPEGHFYLYSSTDPVLDWSLRLVENRFIRKLKYLKYLFKKFNYVALCCVTYKFYLNFYSANVSQNMPIW